MAISYYIPYPAEQTAKDLGAHVRLNARHDLVATVDDKDAIAFCVLLNEVGFWWKPVFD